MSDKDTVDATANAASDRRVRFGYLWLSGLIVALDQATKTIVDRSLVLHESRSVVEGLVRLTYVQNRGAAFGIFSDAGLPYQHVLLALVSLGALLAIAVYAWRLPARSALPQTALALVMGGAVGNLLDRARLGYVIDYVDVYWGSYHWPAFNVADAAISVGVTLLVLDILKNPQGDEVAEPLASSEIAAPAAGRTD
jgi:signal peptidase II